MLVSPSITTHINHLDINFHLFIVKFIAQSSYVQTKFFFKMKLKLLNTGRIRNPTIFRVYLTTYDMKYDFLILKVHRINLSLNARIVSHAVRTLASAHCSIVYTVTSRKIYIFINSNKLVKQRLKKKFVIT